MKLHFLIIIIIIIFIIFLGGFFIWQGICLPKDSALVEEKLFSIEKGQNLFQIAENLEKKGLIENRFLFNFYVLAKGAQRNLQAGEYFLSPSMNIAEIVKKNISGDVAKIAMTIPEGFTINQIEKRLSEKAAGLDENKIKNFKIGDFEKNYDFLETAPFDADLQGYLFPDTYQLFYRVRAEEVVRKMLDNFNRKLTPDLREEIKRQNKTIFEIVTMASLIEKEVRSFEDKKLVSGIFWKRLQAQKPLESCATIAYILDVDKWRYSFEDTRTPSPYNTYLNLGLPPGPICNPGLESIMAAVYPEDSEYWYFLSTPESKTIFSKTLEEHNYARANYLK